MSDISDNGRPLLAQQLDLLISALFHNYPSNMSDVEKAVRIGNILMLLSPIFVRFKSCFAC